MNTTKDGPSIEQGTGDINKILIQKANDRERTHNDANFEEAIRYRCEQINVSKSEGTIVHFVEQKFQFKVLLSLQSLLARVIMEEHIYNFSPPVLNQSFAFLSKTEFIKNDVLLGLSAASGQIDKILNKHEISEKWRDFRDNQFEKNEFINRLNQTNPKAVDELKSLGDKQFSVQYELAEEEYRRNLFYFILFDKFIVCDINQLTPEKFLFMSTIVPPVIVPVEFKYNKISEDKRTFNIQKVGTVGLDKELIRAIETKYDEMHKPHIKYGFTDYKLEFMIRIELNKEKRIVENANLVLIEQISDNIENTCEYRLTRLQNFTA